VSQPVSSCAQASAGAATPANAAPDALLERAAHALDGYAREVEELGAILCSHEELIETHIEKLQSIDRLSQCLSQLAIVLRADDPDHAVGAVTIGVLQQQLRGDQVEAGSDADVFAQLV